MKKILDPESLDEMESIVGDLEFNNAEAKRRIMLLVDLDELYELSNEPECRNYVDALLRAAEDIYHADRYLQIALQTLELVLQDNDGGEIREIRRVFRDISRIHYQLAAPLMALAEDVHNCSVRK